MNLYISILSYLSLGVAYTLLRYKYLEDNCIRALRDNFSYLDSRTQNLLLKQVLFSVVLTYPLFILGGIWDWICDRFNPPED